MNRKLIFDTVRKMMGRGFTPAEVQTLDRALDEAGGAGSQQEASKAPTGIGAAGIELIKRFEGCAKRRPDGRIEAYPDPGTGGDPWTIGWGATHMDGRRVRRGDVIEQSRADALFDEHLVSYASEVARALGGAPTSQNQFDALVSFHYNTGAIFRASLTKKHMAGDRAGAAREFSRWTRAGGSVMRGLVRRREAEAQLYNKD